MDVDNAMPATLDYTVPNAPVDQSDLMLAVTPDYTGDYYLDVPLTFKHLCSAVNVKVGTIPQGSIEAITFKNISNKGTYTIANDAWSVNNASKDNFAVDFVGTSTNYPTAGTETGNPQINDASATFMMIPQTLPDDAEIEITFLHSNTGKEETLKASLKGTSWVMGQTNNYLISITPDYILDFTTEQVDMQDAHYVMVPLTIKAKFLNEGWKLSGTASDGSKVTFCESLTALYVPDSVASVGAYALDECRALKWISLPTLDRVNLASQFIHGGRCYLKTAIFRGGSTLSESSLSQMVYLRKIYLPATLTHIEKDALKQNGATDIYFAGTTEEWEAVQVDPEGNELRLSNITVHFEQPPAEGPEEALS
jgi:hypothetical protein